tara:strand:+ start:6820 stop:7098 length:279 start_codon:yes stop_codon:yes gene_type:complete
MRTPLKILVLDRLINGSLNRVEASIQVGDTALNSTISALHNIHGIEFLKWKEPYRHRRGETIMLTRYQVNERSFASAYRMVSQYKIEKPSKA